MYKINWKKEIVSFFLILGMFISAFFLLPILPEKIPTHWNVFGQVDQYSGKNFIFLIPFISLLIEVGMLYIPYLDPKKDKYPQFISVYDMIRILLVCFFTFLYSVTVLISLGKQIDMSIIMPISTSLLFIILGNSLGKLRQNWYVGIKNPWTLDNEDNWNKTHRFGGKLFVVTGFLGILSIFFPAIFRFPIVVGSIIISTILTMVYSYLLYRKNHNS